MGLVPVLIRPGDKKPVMVDFTKYYVASDKADLERPSEFRITRELLDQWARKVPLAGVGVLCGKAIVADIDDTEIWPIIADLLPRTQPCKHGQRGFSLIYLNDPANPVTRTRTFANRFTGEMMLELLAHGRQTVLPPTIHPNAQRPYAWVSNPWGDPAAALWDCPPGTVALIGQRHVDAIEARLIERGLLKARPLGCGGCRPLGVTLDDSERRRYEAYVSPKIAERLASVRGAASGGRQDALNGAVFALAMWVREGFIPEDRLEADMRAACMENGYIQEDGERAFARQFTKALEDGWDKPLPDLDVGRADRLLGAAPAEMYAPIGFPTLRAPTVEQRGVTPATAYGPASPMPPAGDARHVGRLDLPNAPGYAPPASPMPLAKSLSFTLFDGVLPPEEPELIKDLLPATPGHLAFIAGASGCGKSFCAVAMAVALATGRPFFGKVVRERVGSIIVASEGEGTLGARIWAAGRAAGLPYERLPIARIFRPGNLRITANRERLIAAIREASAAIQHQFGLRTGVTFIDTVQANFTIEEGREGEVTQICEQIREIGFATQTATAPLHHFGKDASQGMRGSSAWQDNADYMLICGGKVNRSTGEISDRYLSLGKTRNDRMGPISKADLQSVDLGINQYGEPRSSCVYVAIAGDPRPAAKAPEITHFEKSYQEIIERNGGDSDGVPAHELRIEFYRTYPNENRTAKANAFKRQSDQLAELGAFIFENETWKRVSSHDVTE